MGFFLMTTKEAQGLEWDIMNGFNVETSFPCQQRESHFVVKRHDFSPHVSEVKYKSNMWLVFIKIIIILLEFGFKLWLIDTIKIIGPELLRTEK